MSDGWREINPEVQKRIEEHLKKNPPRVPTESVERDILNELREIRKVLEDIREHAKDNS